MGKLFNSMVAGALITISLILFNSSGFTPTSLFLLLLNPTSYDTNSFYLLLAGVATLTGGIMIGLAVAIRQDWLARAGIFISLNSIVIAPFIDFYQFLYSQTNFIGQGWVCYPVNSPICGYLVNGGMGQIIGLVIAGPMLLYALWAGVEFIWGGDR